MSKLKTQYVCSSCGSTTPKWLGKCPDCGGWNTFVEEVVEKKSSKVEATVNRLASSQPVRLDMVKGIDTERVGTGIRELDLVLGGGLVKGSVVLIGGEPGVGKSTIMIQIAGTLGKNKSLIYISGEESGGQIKIRADRLGLDSSNIDLLTTSSFEDILATVNNSTKRYDIIILDSIQTVASSELTAAAGTVGQVRHITYRLLELAKKNGITVFIVGQVTKDGNIAGPKVLEHLVDTVLYFEGDYSRGVRLLRTVKNRFGSTNEVGLFEMTDKGLSEMTGDFFMGHNSNISSGQAICPVMEGSRSFLVEIQALASQTFFQFPRRNSNGFDQNRLQMLSAVMEKRGGINLASADIYLNIAGGLKITETAADCAVCAALISSFYDVPLGMDKAFIGEVGLSGEIRTVSNMRVRVSEANRLGITTIYGPLEPINEKKLKSIKITNIKELVKIIAK